MFRATIFPRIELRLALGLLTFALMSEAGQAEVPAHLPRYDLNIQLDTDQHTAVVRQRIVWTNGCSRPAAELTFNAHSHYQLPDKDVGMTSKIFEILRMMPSESLDFKGHALDVRKVRLLNLERGENAEELGQPWKIAYQSAPDDALPLPRPLNPSFFPPWGGEGKRKENGKDLSFHYDDKNDSALVIPLPEPLRQGETITLEMEFVLSLPENYGRWGHWRGITFLTNWLPVLAFYDRSGWQPTPYVSWHQPFFNEAGLFTVRLTLPRGQKVACTSTVVKDTALIDGRQQLDFAPCLARDFAILCSDRFHEYTGECGDIEIRCLAAPEHEHYARFMVESAREALTAYSKWFGPIPIRSSPSSNRTSVGTAMNVPASL